MRNLVFRNRYVSNWIFVFFFFQKHLSMTYVLLDIDIICVVIIINGEILMLSFISGKSCEIV